jgi:hypothetical protein
MVGRRFEHDFRSRSDLLRLYAIQKLSWPNVDHGDNLLRPECLRYSE